MSKKVTFGSKEELNKKREEVFLALTEVERLELFFARMNMHNKMYGFTEKPENFNLIRKDLDRL